MWSTITAIGALLCFLLAFILGLAGTGIGVDLVTLGWVFVALWMLVQSVPIGVRR